MSDAVAAPTPAHDPHTGHSKHLAHHFDTPQQQYASAKLGMWVFLGTEILMFGGLFCAYGVYRYTHPDVFRFAHQALNATLGGINTAVLISSSFTMAMAVRYAQLGYRRALAVCLTLSLLGGAGFMCIKFVEYKTKWEHQLFPGRYNVFNREYVGSAKRPKDLSMLEHGHGAAEESPGAAPSHPVADAHPTAETPAAARDAAWPYADPLAGTKDEPKIKPSFIDPQGTVLAPPTEADHHLLLSDLSPLDQASVSSFFSVYFCMTGLHGIHVLIGMGLISWVLVRGLKNEFGPQYFTPVDLVGLYWHLVDLIWIFLFPLLYLIH